MLAVAGLRAYNLATAAQNLGPRSHQRMSSELLGSPHAMQARQRGLGDTRLWASPGARQGAVGYHSHCGAGLQVCEVQAQTSTQRLGPVHTQTFGL